MSRDCTCGRSPTGKCIGWHKLTEEEYKKKKEESDSMDDPDYRYGDFRDEIRDVENLRKKTGG